MTVYKLKNMKFCFFSKIAQNLSKSLAQIFHGLYSRIQTLLNQR